MFGGYMWKSAEILCRVCDINEEIGEILVEVGEINEEIGEIPSKVREIITENSEILCKLAKITLKPTKSNISQTFSLTKITSRYKLLINYL